MDNPISGEERTTFIYGADRQKYRYSGVGRVTTPHRQYEGRVRCFCLLHCFVDQPTGVWKTWVSRRGTESERETSQFRCQALSLSLSLSAVCVCVSVCVCCNHGRFGRHQQRAAWEKVLRGVSRAHSLPKKVNTPSTSPFLKNTQKTR